MFCTMPNPRRFLSDAILPSKFLEGSFFLFTSP